MWATPPSLQEVQEALVEVAVDSNDEPVRKRRSRRSRKRYDDRLKKQQQQQQTDTPAPENPKADAQEARTAMEAD